MVFYFLSVLVVQLFFISGIIGNTIESQKLSTESGKSAGSPFACNCAVQQWTSSSDCVGNPATSFDAIYPYDTCVSITAKAATPLNFRLRDHCTTALVYASQNTNCTGKSTGQLEINKCSTTSSGSQRLTCETNPQAIPIPESFRDDDDCTCKISVWKGKSCLTTEPLWSIKMPFVSATCLGFAGVYWQPETGCEMLQAYPSLAACNAVQNGTSLASLGKCWVDDSSLHSMRVQCSGSKAGVASTLLLLCWLVWCWKM
eukprot:TRINITY_DN59971_c0_g1_i1.p1 TRINITY_DN59971_c0_g1~~TRINITY_DN59971_c0_g1_i1.p1  ORF type:complete len:258 (-),score=8.82 TRINITY_DN59971_c0_g1_i1:51-824(-)